MSLRPISVLLGFGFFAAALFFSSSSHAEQHLSLSQAIQIALKNNPSLKVEQAKAAEASANRKSVRGLYGPTLKIEANAFVWDDELPFDFNFPTTMSPDILTKLELTSAEQAVIVDPQHQALLSVFGKAMTESFKSMQMGNIRDQLTAQMSVTLAQPITPLLQIHSSHQAASSMEEAATYTEKSKRVEIAEKVSIAYLRMMQAQRFSEVAKTGVEQVKAHLKRARHFYKAGLIGKQDVLKAQVELARAKERVIKTRYRVSMATSALALQMGMGIDEAIVATEKVIDPPKPFALSQRDCISRAMKKRAELKAVTKQHQAAEASRRSAKWKMIPSISAVASYQFTEGQGTFSPQNAFFIGGVLSWDAWQWGHQYYTLKAASEKVRQAKLGQRLLRDGIHLQTKNAYLDLKQSEEALAVARVSIVEAEENYRIEQKRFEQSANTSTDVLDAQLALTRAKLNYTTSLYGYYVARAALYRAMGQWQRSFPARP